MTLSLNEVEALAKKATRGAGYTWGLAEEAGKAVRWLCGQSIDGCAELAALLRVQDGVAYADCAPLPGDVWSATGGRLCPIATGCALSDHAEILPGTLEIEAVSQPILLAPFVAGIAQHLDAQVVLNWDGTRVSTDGVALVVEGTANASPATVSLCLGRATKLLTQQLMSRRAGPDNQTLAILNRFAHRTYAPATEASRVSGAGAGLSDND